MKQGLEQYYSGDENWQDFVKIAEQNTCLPDDYKMKIVQALKGHYDIAIVVYYRLLDESFEWIYKKNPALENLTPIECLETPDLIERLKEALMRMP